MKQVLLSVVLLFPAMVVAESMYKWTDEKGVVHFSTTPPVEQMETELLDKQGPQLISNDQPLSQDGDSSSKSEQTESSSDPAINLSDQAEKQVYCNSLRGNLAMLRSAPRLQITRASGESEVLDDAGREKEAARIQKLFDQFCNN